MHEPVKDEKCSVCHDVHFSDSAAQLTESPPGLCFGCHDPFKGKVVHSPVGDGKCRGCHYPHTASRKGLLPRPLDALCLRCHREKKNGMHGQVRMSEDCTGCHDPHSSDNNNLLLAVSTEDCKGCHGDKAAGQYIHGALENNGCDACHNPHSDPPQVAKKCDQCHSRLGDTSRAHGEQVRDRCHDCHDPHSSDNPNLILSPQTQPGNDCLDCHTSVRRKLERGSVRHEAVSDGACTDCHTIHIGEKPFTIERFPTSMNTPYSRDAYALCFNCHGYSMVERKYTRNDTGFRAGLINLHYIHVYRDGEKGYSCWTCHDPHAAFQPYLINREAPLSMSRYRIRIEFHPNKNGGKCLTNCHTERTYQR